MRRVYLAITVVGGLGCLAVGQFVPSLETADLLTTAAVCLAGVGVAAYLVETWRAGTTTVPLSVVQDARGESRDRRRRGEA